MYLNSSKVYLNLRKRMIKVDIVIKIRSLEKKFFYDLKINILIMFSVIELFLTVASYQFLKKFFNFNTLLLFLRGKTFSTTLLLLILILHFSMVIIVETMLKRQIFLNK